MDKLKYNKKYYTENKERLNEKSKIYSKKHKESILENKKEYYLKNKERIRERRKEYRLKNKEKIAIQKQKYQRKILNTAIGKLSHNVRQSIRRSLIGKGYNKKFSSESILGCTISFFKEYLESKFEPWMTWDNKGLYNGTENYGWDIDHIIPLKTTKTEDDIIRLNHYTNLQPLCSYYNRDIKNANYSNDDDLSI